MVPLTRRETKTVAPAPPRRSTVFRGGYYVHINVKIQTSRHLDQSQTYAKGLHNNRTKASCCTIGQVDGEDCDHVEVGLGIREYLTDLIALDYLILDTNLLKAQPLDGNNSEPWREKGCRGRVIWKDELEYDVPDRCDTSDDKELVSP
jgi:hypothetical protein